MNNPIYYIINKNTGDIAVKETPSDVGTYMLGRTTSHYIIIKSYDKVLQDPSFDVFELANQLKDL